MSSMHSFVSAPPRGSPVDVVAYGDLGVHLGFNMTANGGDRQQESIRTVCVLRGLRACAYPGFELG